MLIKPLKNQKTKKQDVAMAIIQFQQQKKNPNKHFSHSLIILIRKVPNKHLCTGDLKSPVQSLNVQV